MKIPKIRFYSEGTDWSPGVDMPSLLNRHKEFEEVKFPHLADLVVFNGGADIATEIYGEKPVMRGVPLKRSRRDQAEIELFDECVKTGVFMLGICRGAQFLNCMNGGSLWQHVDNHGSSHIIYELKTARIMTATSTHHQMMRPGQGAELIAVAGQSRNKHCEAEHRVLHENFDMATWDDAEVCYYQKTRSLCLQGHPEYIPSSDFANWSVELLLNKFYEEPVHIIGDLPVSVGRY